MDEIIRSCANKHIKNKNNMNAIENSVINPNHSFYYDPHFRGMLIRVVGLAQVERLETKLDPSKFELLKSSLGTLVKARNDAAHNYVSQVTTNILAPSTIKVHFDNVYTGLKDLDKCLRQLKV